MGITNKKSKRIKMESRNIPKPVPKAASPRNSRSPTNRMGAKQAIKPKGWQAPTKPAFANGFGAPPPNPGGRNLGGNPKDAKKSKPVDPYARLGLCVYEPSLYDDDGKYD